MENNPVPHLDLIPNNDLKSELGRKAIFSKDTSRSPLLRDRDGTIERTVT
jgi:hypothetical protein